MKETEYQTTYLPALGGGFEKLSRLHRHAAAWHFLGMIKGCDRRTPPTFAVYCRIASVAAENTAGMLLAAQGCSKDRSCCLEVGFVQMLPI